MSMRNVHFLTIAALSALLVLATGNGLAVGDEPQPQLRTFLVLSPEDFPDVEGNASQFIVTHAGQRRTELGSHLETADCSTLFPGRKWYIGGYITHVTTDGPQTLFVYWLDELPPSGAIAYTGPDGDAIGQPIWVRPATSGECDNGGWFIEDEPNGGFARFVVTGCFSR